MTIDLQQHDVPYLINSCTDMYSSKMGVPTSAPGGRFGGSIPNSVTFNC